MINELFVTLEFLLHVHVHAHVYSYVMSEPYSRVPGDLNWRYRVVDIHIFVSGPPHMLKPLQEMLEGKTNDLHALTVRRNYLI